MFLRGRKLLPKLYLSVIKEQFKVYIILLQNSLVPLVLPFLLSPSYTLQGHQAPFSVLPTSQKPLRGE